MSPNRGPGTPSYACPWDLRASRPSAGSSPDNLLVLGDSDVHVVVVIREGLHDVPRAGEPRVWADEDELRSRGDKTVH
jgi:hypothetical protein